MPTLYHQNHQPLPPAIAPHRDWRFWILDFGLENLFLSQSPTLVIPQPYGDRIFKIGLRICPPLGYMLCYLEVM